jgi:hypothetical protein
MGPVFDPANSPFSINYNIVLKSNLQGILFQSFTGNVPLPQDFPASDGPLFSGQYMTVLSASETIQLIAAAIGNSTIVSFQTPTFPSGVPSPTGPVVSLSIVMIKS